MSLIMMLLVFWVGSIQINKVLLLIIQILIGGIVYMGMSLMVKNKNIILLKEYIRYSFERKKNN